MNVEKTTITGDLYGYENSTNTVLKSDYGVFLFAEEGNLEGCTGRVAPYMVEFLDGEELIEESVSIDAYSNEDNLFIPVFEATSMIPSRVFVIDESIAVRFGGIKETAPNVIQSDSEPTKFVEVYGSHLTDNYQFSVEYICRDVVQEVFDNNPVDVVTVV